MDALCAKLTNPLREVRHRALHTLHSKLQCGLLRPEALFALVALPRNLLSLLDSPEEGHAQAREALALLEALALHPTTAKSLAALGAAQILERLDADPERGGAVADEVAAVARALSRRTGAGPSGAYPSCSRCAAESAASASAPAAHRHWPDAGAAWDDQLTPSQQAWEAARAAEKPAPVPAARVGASRALTFPELRRGATAQPEPRPPLPPVDPSTLPPLLWMSLPRAPMGAHDWQAVLQATVQLSMDDAHVLRGACASVGGSLLHDVPLSGILSRPALCCSLLSLLRASELSEVGEIATLALDAIAELVSLAAAALRSRADPLYCSSLLAPPPPGAATADGAAPTAPSDDRGGFLGGGPFGGAARDEEAEGAWPVWRLAGEIWSASTPLLRHERALPRCVPLLLRTLPLLYLPPPNAGAEAVRGAATLWRGYLGKLCDVLRYHRLLGPDKNSPSAAESDALPRPLSPRAALAAPVLLLALAAAATPPPSLLRMCALIHKRVNPPKGNATEGSRSK